jgi:hypothetical protein
VSHVEPFLTFQRPVQLSSSQQHSAVSAEP